MNIGRDITTPLIQVGRPRRIGGPRAFALLAAIVVVPGCRESASHPSDEAVDALDAAVQQDADRPDGTDSGTTFPRLLPPPCNAGDVVFFVATDGSDENPGSEAQPWATLAKAAATAVPGSTVLVKPGVYRETLAPEHSGLPEQCITYAAFSPDVRPVIDGENVRYRTVDVDGVSFTRIEGFELIGSVDTSVYVAGDGVQLVGNAIHDNGDSLDHGGVRFGPGNGILIEGNEIYDNAGNGIEGAGTSNTQALTIRNNRIHDNGKDGMIDGSGANWLIEWNWIYNHTNQETHADSTQFQRPVDGLVIRYNRFWNSTQHIYIPDDVGPTSVIYRNIEIYGNEIYHDESSYPVYESLYPKGIFITNNRENVFENIWIYNNTIVGTYFGILLLEGAAGSVRGDVVLRNNLLAGCNQFLTISTRASVDADYDLFSESGAGGNFSWNGAFYDSLGELRTAVADVESAGVLAEPGFLDARSFDHRISEASPAADRGDPDTATRVPLRSPLFDLDGTERWSAGAPAMSNRIDIGAYEAVQ